MQQLDNEVRQPDAVVGPPEGPETLNIDKEFASIHRSLTADEEKRLAENIFEDGCREPIVVWRGTGTILDGHNRYRICRRLNKPFTIREITLTRREDAVTWIIANQLGRRNLTENELSYFRGKQYGLEKQAHGGARRSAESRAHSELLKRTGERTADRLADQHRVSRSTIKRESEYAKAIDMIETNAPGFRQNILTGELQLTRTEIVALALASPGEQQAALADGAVAAREVLSNVRRERKAAKRAADAAAAASDLTSPMPQPLEGSPDRAQEVFPAVPTAGSEIDGDAEQSRPNFDLTAESDKLECLIRTELEKWPSIHRMEFIEVLRQAANSLEHEGISSWT